MFLVERTVPGEFLNKDGTVVADEQVADIFTSVNELVLVLTTLAVQAATPRSDIGALVPVTQTRVLGTPFV